MRVPGDPPEASRDSDTQRRRILIVDDEATVREVVGHYLEIEGYAVSHATSGLEALRMATAFPPDMLILDLTLPGIDGLEVCRRLRDVSAVPILMLTARADDVDKLLGFGLGADDYMTKPFNPRELVARVHAIMRRIEATSVDLTPKEFDLLLFLVAHPKQVFAREQLLQHVWNYENYG